MLILSTYNVFSSQIHSPWRGDKVDSGKGLSYRPANLCSHAGRYDNPMPESTLSPRQGLWIWLLYAQLCTLTSYFSYCRKVVTFFTLQCAKISKCVLPWCTQTVQRYNALSKAYWNRDFRRMAHFYSYVQNWKKTPRVKSKYSHIHRVYRVPGFLSSRPNWVPPPSLTSKRVYRPSLDPRREHSLAGGGVGDPIPTLARHSGTLGIL